MNKKTKVFDASALRRDYNYALPYDPLCEAHPMDESVPQPEVTNLVYEVPYFTDDGGSPPLWDRWLLTGTSMSNCMTRNDGDANYVMRVCMPDGKQVCSILMHTNTCIVPGPRSIVDLVTVCNTLVCRVREHVRPHGATFHVGSVRNKLHNTVVRLNVDLPIDFSRLEALLRPQHTVRRSDESTRTVAATTDRIPHFMMSINVAPNPRKKKDNKPMVKMYEHKTVINNTLRIMSKICLNGIPSIDRAKDMLLEFYFFILEHRAALLYAPGEIHKMAALIPPVVEAPKMEGPPPKKKHRIE